MPPEPLIKEEEEKGHLMAGSFGSFANSDLLAATHDPFASNIFKKLLALEPLGEDKRSYTSLAVQGAHILSEMTVPHECLGPCPKGKTAPIVPL